MRDYEKLIDNIREKLDEFQVGDKEIKVKRKIQDPKSIIRCGDEDDAMLAYMAMFRYAFGRMTYMPSAIIEIIKANAEYLTTPTLKLLDCDLTREAKRYERAYKGRTTSNYGMECDREDWLAFHDWVKDELKKRKEPENDTSVEREKD